MFEITELHGKFFLMCPLFNQALKILRLFLIPVMLLFVKSPQIWEEYEVKWFHLTLVGRVYFPSGKGTL